MIEICICLNVHVNFCYYKTLGPLTYKHNDGKEYLVGVVSWGIGCGERNQAGVYGRVTKVLGWIKQQTSKTC